MGCTQNTQVTVTTPKRSVKTARRGKGPFVAINVEVKLNPNKGNLHHQEPEAGGLASEATTITTDTTSAQVVSQELHVPTEISWVQVLPGPSFPNSVTAAHRILIPVAQVRILARERSLLLSDSSKYSMIMRFNHGIYGILHR